jgi:EAL domain-containing protein (putative c-di-GMP-specific phosphodiesterase class I)
MMAKNLGLEVIAEGVETEQELHYLNRRGCLIYQGYYFSKPLEEGPFVQMLRRGCVEPTHLSPSLN